MRTALLALTREPVRLPAPALPASDPSNDTSVFVEWQLVEPVRR